MAAICGKGGFFISSFNFNCLPKQYVCVLIAWPCLTKGEIPAFGSYLFLFTLTENKKARSFGAGFKAFV